MSTTDAVVFEEIEGNGPSSMVSYRLKAHFLYLCKVRFVENSAPERSKSASIADIFFSKSLMTRLTLTLTLTDSHDDENNVILYSGFNLV